MLQQVCVGGWGTVHFPQVPRCTPQDHSHPCLQDTRACHSYVYSSGFCVSHIPLALDSKIESNKPVVNISTSSPQFGDRLPCFYSAWETITMDRCVLSIVGLHHTISVHPPIHSTTPSLFRDFSHEPLFLQQVLTLCALGALEEVSLLHWERESTLRIS